MTEVPADGLFDAFLELEGGFPSEFRLEFAAVDGVAHVVAEAVGDVGYQAKRLSFRIAEQTVYCFDYYLDEVDILPFIEAADVVRFSNFAFVENEIDGAGVIFDKKPVAYVLSFAIDRKRLAMTDVVDEQRYQLFWELIWAVVVRAVGNERRHAVCVVICADEVVAGCF